MRRPFQRACLIAAIGTVTSCHAESVSEPRLAIRIAAASAGGVYHQLAVAMADVFTAKVPAVEAVATSGRTTTQNLLAVESRDAELAIVPGDVAYLAYTHGTDEAPGPRRRVRAMAVLYSNVTHVLVLNTSPVRAIGDLRGRRVAIGVSVPEPRTFPASIEIVVEAHGMGREDIAIQRIDLPDLPAALRDGTVDAGFVSAGFPVPAIYENADALGLRLLPISADAAARIRSVYPFFRAFSIPAGTYPGQATPVPVVGIDNLLICRDDMTEELAYQLTAALFDSLPALRHRLLAARQIDGDRAAATPIPLHPGAARYYRERELLRW